MKARGEGRRSTAARAGLAACLCLAAACEQRPPSTPRGGDRPAPAPVGLAASVPAAVPEKDETAPAPTAPEPKPNVAPVAEAGGHGVAEVGKAARLDGTASRDPDGGPGPIAHRWRQVVGPDTLEEIDSFECPRDWGDRYGTRVRGFVHPPATGEYVFWIASDDAGELRLSEDDRPGLARAIARVDGWTSPGAWDVFPSQKSAPVRLEAGRRYYVEALQKEGGGGDHLAVAWRPPGGEREAIPGRHLSPWSEGDSRPAGSITREVWTGVHGSTLEDLTSCPAFPGGAEAVIADAAAAATTFTAERSGRYVFELTVSDGEAEASDRVAVLVTDRLANGGFEEGEGGRPARWGPEGDSALAELEWEDSGGRGGSRCVSISTRDAARPAVARWRQPLQLAPYTPYLLKGYVKGEGLRAGEIHPAVVGTSHWRAENGPAPGVASLDWTRFEVDFATGPSGSVEVFCKLGALWHPASGKVWFDDLSLERNPDVETFEGGHFVLHLYSDQVELAGRENIEKIIAYMDLVCEAYAELTGREPGGDRQSAWAPDKWNIGALGWAGNPTLWSGNRDLLRNDWRRAGEGFTPEVFLHELAHNYDHPSWTFHGHFCELKMYYALETRNLAICEDGWNRGAATRHRWEFRSRRNREIGVMDELSQTYRNIEIKEKVGWEPFKKVFRHFLALAPGDVPPTPWGKFKLWHDKLSEFSGFDAWSVYSPEEIEFVRFYYGPKPEQRELSGVAAAEDAVWLADVKWSSAEVGWEKPQAGFYPSGKGLHLRSVYAHAHSRYVYPTAGAWKRLAGSFGLRRGHAGSVVFVVKGDGKELFRSGLVKDFEERELAVDISGVRELELVVEDGGNGKNSDHGIWFDPRLQR